MIKAQKHDKYVTKTKPLFLCELFRKQLLTAYGDAPEENKETAEPKACEGDRRGLCFRAVGELAVMLLCGGIFTRAEYSHALRRWLAQKVAGILLAGFTAFAVALRAILRTCEAPEEQSALASLQASLQIRFA